MLIDSLMMMVRNWLRVPPGASVRKSSGPSTSSAISAEDNDYVSIITDITVDDICMGDEPLSINYKTDTPDNIALRFKSICDEANSIVKWVAADLCLKGVSVYKASINKEKNTLVLMPDNREFRFYLTTDKRVVAYLYEDIKATKTKNEKDLLIFINYRKRDLVDIEDRNLQSKSNLKYEIVPSPMQLKYAERSVAALETGENAINKYRALISRPARWVNVDVGTAQGDTQNEVIETISSAINASSDSLTPTSDISSFDDNIPVLPNRRGIGKPEIAESIPNANIKDIVDIEYALNKLCLMMRFPASYIDFSKELGSSAVSMIRSDLRYSKMCATVRSKIVTTFNDFVNSSKILREWEPVFSLTTIPNSEDSDVVDALGDYVDLCQKIEEFVTDEDPKVSLHRLSLIQHLFSTSTNSPALQKWIEDFRNFIKSGAGEAELEGGDSLGSDDFGGDIDESGIDISGAEEIDTDVNEEPSDVEFVEPQTSQE